jgi:hypothetical protein
MLGVIPIMAEPCDKKDIPPMWATLHRHDATQGYEKAIKGLIRSLGLAGHDSSTSDP